ncbi:MAG: hypothetical protein LUF33_08680 [Clostridiales bacterium]|nr:hypothetical protein [Clostridiales bacterium]
MSVGKRKILSAVFAVITAVSAIAFSPTAASAAEISNSQDGLVAVIDSDKESYGDSDDILLSFKVTNTNDYDVANVSLEAIMPDGLVIKDEGSTEKSVVSLAAGETIELSLTAEKEISSNSEDTQDTTAATGDKAEETTDAANTEESGSNNVASDEATVASETEKSDNSDDNATASSGVSVNGNSVSDSTASEANDSGSSNSDSESGTGSNDNSSVKTGESNVIAVLIALIIMSLFAIVLGYKFRKQSKRLLSMVLCLCISSSAIAAISFPALAATESAKTFMVEKELSVGNQNYAIQAKVTYDKQSDDSDDTYAVTRGEWVNMLVEEFSMSLENLDEAENPYSDIDGNKYYDSIITTYYNAVLPSDLTEFNPDAGTTRDFAAFTLNNCLCYVPNESLSCDDYSSITYTDAASALVERGYFSLIDNNFMPQAYVTSDEMSKIKDLTAEALSLVEFDENHENVVDVNDDATVFNDNIIESVDDNTVVLTLNDETTALKEGSVFFAPDPENTELTVAYKVESISISGDEVILEVSEPEFEEMFNEIDVQGKATANANSAESLVDGVKTAKNSSETVGANENNSEVGFDFNNDIYASGETEIDASKLYFDKTYSFKSDSGNEISVKLKGGLENPVIKYAVYMQYNWFLARINDNFSVYLELDNTLSFDGVAKVVAGKGESGKLDLAKFSIPICGVLSADVTVSLVVTAEGEISIDYSLENQVGVIINKNDGVRFIKNFGDQNLTIEAKVTSSVGLRPEVALSLAGNKIVGINAEIGAKGTADIKNMNDSQIHCDLSTYMYFNVGFDTDSFLKSVLEFFNVKTSDTLNVLAEDNSPIKIHVHLEGLEEINVVDACTYRYITGKVLSDDIPISDYTVSMYNGENTVVDNQSVENDFGEFGFALPSEKISGSPTSFTIEIKKDGYETYAKDYTVKTGDDTDLGEIQLSKSDDTDTSDLGLALFSKLPETFVFSSGVGGWATTIALNDDGTFSGEYHDSDLGSSGDGYSGTVYICNFTGKFSEPKMVNEYIYSMNLEYLNIEEEVGTEYIKDNIRYINSDPSGFDSADEFLVYLPGCPLDETADEFKLWSFINTDIRTTIPSDVYGIYNVQGKCGFMVEDDDSLWKKDYQYYYNDCHSQLSPSYSGKSHLTFWPESGAATLGLMFDWTDDNQTDFVATDSNGTGDYNISLDFSEDYSSVKVTVESLSGYSLTPWGGTTDGTLSVEYQVES